MEKAKYVIVNGSAIVFSAAIKHSEIASKEDVQGAGFVTFYSTDPDGEVKASAHGESFSLGVKSRGQIDSDIISRQILNMY